MDKTIVIFDTEYTSWQNCMQHGWLLPQRQEIVQIGALKVNTTTLEVKEEFCEYIIPTYNPILSDYFIDLTGITNEKIQNEGLSFTEAYKKFTDFANGCTCYSYANPAALSKEADGEIIRLNLEWNNLPPPKLIFKNIAKIFEIKFTENNLDVSHPSSGKLATVLGREKNLKHLGLEPHNALYDVYSILEGLRYFHVKIK